MKELIRTDKNGTKYWRDDHVKCDRCGGKGVIPCYGAIYSGICFACDGAGFVTEEYKEYTPEYEAKLKEKRDREHRENAAKNNAKLFKNLNLAEDGTIYLVIEADTFKIKDELKEIGAKAMCLYQRYLWYTPEPNKFENIKVTIDAWSTVNDYGEIWLRQEKLYDIYDAEMQKKRDAAKDEIAHTSKGWLDDKEGDKVSLLGKFMGQYDGERKCFNAPWKTETYHVYYFLVGDKVISWDTTAYREFSKDKEYELSGTVKQKYQSKYGPATKVSRLSAK